MPFEAGRGSLSGGTGRGSSSLGDDHASFLHNILSNDVASLRPGGRLLRKRASSGQQGRRGRGRCSSTRHGSSSTSKQRPRDRVREHLERFLVAEDVEIEAATEVILGVYGPAAFGLLGGVGLDAPMEILAHGDGSVDGVPVRVVRVERTGGSGFELHLAPENASALEERLLGVEGASPVGEATLEVLRLEGGFPRRGHRFRRDAAGSRGGARTRDSLPEGLLPRAGDRGASDRSWGT